MSIRADQVRLRRHLTREATAAIGLRPTPGRVGSIVAGATIAALALAAAAVVGLVSAHGG